MTKEGGEEFEYRKLELKVVAQTRCAGCAFYTDEVCSDTQIVGECSSTKRSDNKSVIFKRL